MRVLVTGGSGFIGSHVVDKLVKARHSVRVLDLKEPYRKDVEYYRGNILSKKDVRESLKDIDIVYHFAAASNIDLVKNNPMKTVEFNVMGTVFLLEEVRQVNIQRFILASSVFVHDTRGHLYTTSKLSSEMLCKDYNKLFSVPYTILRIGTAYGPRSRNADVVSIFVKRALKKEDLVIKGSGKQKRNFIYVEDIAEGSVRAINKIAENKTYCIAYPKSTTINQLARIIKKVVNSEVIIQRYFNSPREDDYLGEIGDLKKTFLELKWQPKYSLKDGIKKFLKWLKKNNISEGDESK